MASGGRDREANLQVALAMGFEHEIMETCAGIEIFAKKLRLQ